MKLFLGMVALFVTTLASNAVVAGQSDRDLQLASFGNWEIRKGIVSDSYILVGRSREGDGQFWLNCQQDGLVNVAMPIEGRDGRERLRSFPVTISSDAGDRKNLDLLVFEGFVAVALDYQGGQNDKLTSFLKILSESRQTFRIAYGERVFEFDVSRLPSAQARFTALCGHSRTAMGIAPQE